MRGRRLPGDGAREGLFEYLIERLVQMPYLWLIWLIVLVTCYLFVALDQRSAVGRQQGLYAISALIVLALFRSEIHSVGYYTIWALGVLGLATYWVTKLMGDRADVRES